MRLTDVEEYGLDSEPWREKVKIESVVLRLRGHGATDEEIRFLVEDGEEDSDDSYTSGRRVELNAFTSEQFIDWLEAKLIEHGVEKVIPAEDTLALKYRRCLIRRAVNQKIAEVRAEVRSDVHGPVAGLKLLVELDDALAGHHRLDAVRGHLYEMAGDHSAAVAHYRAAAERTASIPERHYLSLKAARLARPAPEHPGTEQ